ncbi:8366_t:CDS:2, partial [Paraglomus occultum]
RVVVQNSLMRVPSTIRSILALEFMTRLQICVQGQTWTINRSRITLRAYPLTTKEAKYVAGFLLKIFTQSGAPTILQFDNGKEFVASIIKEIVALPK